MGFFKREQERNNYNLDDFDYCKSVIYPTENWCFKVDDKFGDEMRLLIYLRDFVGWNRTVDAEVEWTSTSSNENYVSKDGEQGLFDMMLKVLFPPTTWDDVKPKLDEIDNKYITKYYWKHIDNE